MPSIKPTKRTSLTKLFYIWAETAEIDDLIDFINEYYCYSDKVKLDDLSELLKGKLDSEETRTAALTLAVRRLKERLDGKIVSTHQ